MKLKDIVIKLDKSHIKAGEGLENGLYPLFTCSSNINKYLDSYLYDDEAIIIGTGGNAVINYYKGKFNYSTDCIAVKGNNQFDTKYLYYNLIFQIDYISSLFRGVGLKHLNKNDFFNIDIVDRSMEEQLEIVKKMDVLYKAIKVKEDSLSKYDILVNSKFIELFGNPVTNDKNWPLDKLSNNINLINGRAYSQNELLNSGKYKVLRVGNFFSNNEWYFSDLELENNKYCSKGDLLYAWSASFGPKIWDGEKVIYHYHIWKVEFNEKYTLNFLYSLLNVTTDYLKLDTHGIGMVHLTKNGMEQLNIIVPPISVQNKYSSYFEKIKQAKSIIEEEIKKLSNLCNVELNNYYGEKNG